jgi:hypothetical protein
VASKAKALFDYFYFRPFPREWRVKDYNVVEDLRLDLDEWVMDDIDEFSEYVRLAKSEKMSFFYKNLRRNVWR